MSGISFKGAVSGGLNILSPLAQQVLDDPAVAHWFQAEASAVTLSGSDITTWTDRKAGAQLTSVSGKRAALEADAINGYSAARFVRSQQDRATWVGAQPDLTQPHSWVILSRTIDVSAPMALFASYTTTSSMDGLVNDPGGLGFYYKHGSNRVPNIPYSVDDWNAHALCYDGTNIRVRANGESAGQVSAAGNPGTAVIGLGSINSSSQFFDGLIADFIYVNGCVLDNPALIEKLRTYFDDVYGVIF